MKLALGIIAKDEKEQLSRIIGDYGSYFDEIHIAYDDDLAKLDVSPDNVFWYKYKWIDDFSDKRNFLQGKIKDSGCDYYLRLDTDDSIVNPGAIKTLVGEARQVDTSVIYCYYDYAVDEWGNTNAAHWRETIIKADDNLVWQKTIHENIVPRSKVGFSVYLADEIRIKHNIDFNHSIESARRNLKFLLKEYERDKDATDPRTLAYLGRTLLGFEEWDKAEYFLRLHASKSGWDEDRCLTYCQLADIYYRRKDYDKAIACGFEALHERVDFPDAYFKLHDAYMGQRRWQKAIDWALMGFRKAKERQKTFMILDPSSYTWRPALSVSFCYYQIGEFENAFKYFSIAKKAAPTLDFVVSNEKLYSDAYFHRQFMKKFYDVYVFVKENGTEENIKSLIGAVPNCLQDNESVISLKHKYFDPVKWSDNSLVIFCGHTQHEWSPKSVETGIGGSEEAVIYMSKELQKLGIDVTIFNNCGEDEGEYDGVKYLNWSKFNPKDEFNWIIAWRNILFEMIDITAKKRMIWLHDVIQPHQFTNVDNFEKVFVLSEFHKTLLPDNVPEEKIYVTSNGLNIEDFRLNGVKRSDNRVIYASSYDRGLEHLLKIWPDVRKQIPDAELHIYYGWENFDNYVLEGYADPKFKERMVEMMKQPGVFEHGRIGHKQLIEEFKKAAFWAYPCDFDEISCITAMKAQVCGCLPVVTNFAALKETVKDGVIVNGNPKEEPVLNEFKHKLIACLKNRVRYTKPDHDFSWKGVAVRWKSDLLS